MIGSPVFRYALTPGWANNSLWRAAQAVPSLDLRLAESKSLVDAATGQSLVTFTRASSGTYVGSDGLIKTATTNEPRFDHNPTTGESLGLLVEEQRTNLLLRSEEFNDATWGKENATVSTDAITSPSGTQTADFIVENTSSALHRISSSSVSFVSGTAYTFSVYAKSANRNLYINARGTFNAGSSFNLSTGSINVGIGTASIQALPNGWYRCSVTGTASATASGSPFLQINTNTAATDETYTGNGTSGLYIWGAQLEAGAFATSYIPTTTATVTRSADVASITGTNFSSWYRQDEGTVFSSSIAQAGGETYDISNNTATNRYYLRYLGAQHQLFGIDASVSQAQIYDATGAGIAQTQSAGVYKTNDIAIRTNGGAAAGVVANDSSATIGTMERLSIGSNAINTGAFLNGTIRRLTYWPQRLSNSTLQTLTQ